MSPGLQRKLLASLDLGSAPHGGSFETALASAGYGALRASPLEILQLNLGRLCNMACRHCHVDAGPQRVDEVMSRQTLEECLRVVDRTEIRTVDLTGGAPELNPEFRWLVRELRGRGFHVVDRCNLTVLLLERSEGLVDFLAEHEVEVVCSLPHWRRRSTDAQRGEGTYERSVEALRMLNRAGYGTGDSRRRLTVVANPVGAFLPGSQASMEREWRAGMDREHGVSFDTLITITNMPIARFLAWLERRGNLGSYLELLVTSFNPATVAGLMCINTVSVSWDGRLFDCDFNQMLDLRLRSDGRPLATVADLDADALAGRRIVTGRHCFGCTAGAGSSCGGVLVDES